MIQVKELKPGDLLQYQEGVSVTYVREEGNKVIVKDDVLGEIKILKEIFEKNYRYL